MNTKDKLLNMPAWKMIVCVFFMVFLLSVAIEEVLSHTVFHVIDRMLTTFAAQAKEDDEDIDNMAKNNQKDNCVLYHRLQREKADLVKLNSNNFGHLFSSDIADADEQTLAFATQYHEFDLEKCLKETKKNAA